MSVKDLLQGEIERQLGSLEDIPLCSEESKIAGDGVVKLLDKYNEMVRIENERQNSIDNRNADMTFKYDQMQAENDLKEKQLAEERSDHKIKNALTLITFAGGVILTVWGVYKTIEFEETGTVTTIVGRGFFNKIIPKK